LTACSPSTTPPSPPTSQTGGQTGDQTGSQGGSNTGPTGQPNTDPGNHLPQPGDIKEIDGIAYVYTHNERYGINLWVDNRLNHVSYDDGTESYNARKANPSLPSIYFSPASNGGLSQGSTPDAIAQGYIDSLACQPPDPNTNNQVYAITYCYSPDFGFYVNSYLKTPDVILTFEIRVYDVAGTINAITATADNLNPTVIS